MRAPGSALPVHYVRHIADQLRSMGVDVARWLRHCRLTEAQLRDPELEVAFPIFEQLVLDALALSREPALGLFVGQRLVASTHGMLGYAALSSGSIREALELVEKFGPLRIALIAVSHEQRGREVRVHFRETRPLGELRRPVLEAVLLSIKNVLDAISLGRCEVLEVSFPFPTPEDAPLARELFRCPVRYGRAAATLALPAQVLDQPLALADPEAFREAALICQRELDKLTAPQTLANRVRRLLLEKQGGFPSLQVAARLFHLAPRTFHRRLVDEGTSFRALLEEVRHTLAVEQLKSPHFSVEEIAYGLGYSELANFRRAFKRWEGMPPSEYRDKALRRAKRAR